MLTSTVARLRCPRPRRKPNGSGLCLGRLELSAPKSENLGAAEEVRFGSLQCVDCRAKFPILAGVAMLVPDVRAYLQHHVRGISRQVPDEEIPAEFLREFLAARAEIESEHIEDDLEAERVVALYFMNHYLRVQGSAGPEFWAPRDRAGDPLIADLVRRFWDHGPLQRIADWIAESGPDKTGAVIELGCGVGGLWPRIRGKAESFLGVDSSFASIALARHAALGAGYRGELRIPGDLLKGPVAETIHLPTPPAAGAQADYVVGDIDAAPVERATWGTAVALNAIDMMEDPASLPRLKRDLLRASGTAIQSCPYIWHPVVAERLRKKLPKSVRDSAQAAELLYEQAGFRVQDRVEHLPWLFFKHLRQLEIYSVHLFRARLER